MADLNIPLQGMQRAEANLNTAASRIARAPAQALSPQPAAAEDTVNLSAELISLMQSRNDFGANVKVAQTFDQMNQSLLSILG